MLEQYCNLSKQLGRTNVATLHCAKNRSCEIVSCNITFSPTLVVTAQNPEGLLDCKTVRIFAYSSTREQSKKRSGTRLKTDSEIGERRYGRVRLARFARVRLLRHTLPISLLILRKKPTVLQSKGLFTQRDWVPDCELPREPNFHFLCGAFMLDV